jgi:hypothetical protein
MIEQEMDGFRRRVEFCPAYDKRHTDPKKNYGVRGMELRFVLIGPMGATQFVFSTGLQLPHVRKEWFDKHNGEFETCDLNKPMGVEVGYHAREAQYEGQTARPCGYLGGECFYDGSGLRADEFYPTFLAEGDDAVWTMLREEYDRRFASRRRNRR